MCYQWSLSLGLIRLSEQIADGVRFPGSSSLPHHLSCHILSSESVRSTVPSVLRLPWLHLKKLEIELPYDPAFSNGTPLQYSCLENPIDRRAWWAAVHGVAELDMTE